MHLSYNRIKSLSNKNIFFRELLSMDVEEGIELSIYESEYRRFIKKHKCPKFSIKNPEELEHYFRVFNYFGNDEFLERMYREIVIQMEKKKRKENLKILNGRKARFYSLKPHYPVNLKFWKKHIKSFNSYNPELEGMEDYNLPESIWLKNKSFMRNCGINKHLSLSFFEKHLDKILNYNLIKNPRITEEFLERNITKFYARELFRNPNISENFIRKYLLIDRRFPYHVNMSEQFLEEYFDRIEDFISMDIIHENFVRKHFDKFRFRDLSRNKNLSESFFREYADRLDWHNVSSNSSLKEPFFEEFIDRVDWNSISYNKSISESFFRKYIHKVDWNTIYNNPNVGEDFYLEFSDKIQWELITGAFPRRFYERLYTKHIDKINITELLSDLGREMPESFVDRFLHILDKECLFYINFEDFSYDFYKKHIEYLKEARKYEWYRAKNIPLSFVEKHGGKYEILSKKHMDVYRINLIDEKLVSFDEMWKRYL